jgi:hypothetical protein
VASAGSVSQHGGQGVKCQCCFEFFTIEGCGPRWRQAARLRWEAWPVGGRWRALLQVGELAQMAATG